MGLTIVLESEDGRALATVEDLKNRLYHLLPKHDDDHFQMIRFIDWYGDTVFNRLQAATFLKEWETLRGNGNSKEDEDLVSAIRELAFRLQTEPHLYLSSMETRRVANVGTDETLYNFPAHRLFHVLAAKYDSSTKPFL